MPNTKTKTRSKLHFTVRVDGDDRADGSCERPFATPTRARNAIRAARRSAGRKLPAEVVLGGGTWELPETLAFDSRDGDAVWRAASGERAVLSGGRQLSGFAESVVEGRTRWTLDLPGVASGDWNFTQLWMDGSRRPRPRLPKQGFNRFAGLADQTDSGFAWGKGPDRAEYAEGDIRPFRNLEDVRLIAQQLWFEMPMRIIAVEEKSRIVRFHSACIGSLRDESGKFARYFLDNVGEALSEQGEWYLDRPTGQLRILPRSGDERASAQVVAPRLTRLVHIAGSARKSVSNLVFEGIAFRHCDWLPPAEYVGSGQAGFNIPGAILIENAESCVFYGCEIAHVAQYGVQIGRGSHDCRVVACHLHDLGAGGVRVDHEWLKVHESGVRDPFAAKGETRPRAATVSDNEIHDGGHVSPGSIGVFVGNAGHCRVLHNHVHNLRYTGISVGWTWGYAPNATVCNRIDGNHIHHVNHERYLSDNGAIYVLGEQPGSTISGNHIHGIGAYHYGGWGIYLDEGSSFIRVSDNTVHHCQDAGFVTHYGRSNRIENNLFAWNGGSQVNPGQRPDPIRSALISGNLIAWEHGSLFPVNVITLRTASVGRNLLWCAAGPARFSDGLDLAAFQSRGQAAGSVEVDPLLIPTADGGWTVMAGSPARNAGVRIPRSDQAGPRWRGAPEATFAAWCQRFPDAAPTPAIAVRLSFPESGLLRVRIENHGAVAAPAGKLRLVGSPGVTVSKTQVTWPCLAAGAHSESEHSFTIPEGEGRWWIETRSASAQVPAVALCGATPGSRPIARVTDPGNVAGIADALAGVPELELTAAGRVHARARWALAGDHLLVQAEIDDPQLLPHPIPWEGACLEVFAAAGAATAESGFLRHVFLRPDAAIANLEILVKDGRDIFALPGSSGTASKRSGGWTLCARLPLAGLRVAPQCAGFFGEMKASVRPQPGAALVSAWAYGATTAFASTDGLPWLMPATD